MTLDATAPHDGDGEPSGLPTEAPHPSPPPPPPALASNPVAVLPTRTPRAGELTPGWRLVTALVWITTTVALGSVWRVSEQLGLSTWWIGPRGEPNPLIVQLAPFLPGVLMVLASINHVRRLPWFGIVASALVIAVGVADLGGTARLAALEIAIGAAALVASLASLSGSYRPIAAPSGVPSAAPVSDA